MLAYCWIFTWIAAYQEVIFIGKVCNGNAFNSYQLQCYKIVRFQAPWLSIKKSIIK
jgi:hypothetical protein